MQNWNKRCLLFIWIKLEKDGNIKTKNKINFTKHIIKNNNQKNNIISRKLTKRKEN